MRWLRRVARRLGTGERGDASVEAAIFLPLLGILVLVVVFGGRHTTAEQGVQSAASAAARSASIARSTDTAHADAVAAATASLDNHGVNCVSTDVSVDLSGFSAPVGTDAQVTVEVTCQVGLADLSVPGMPGSISVSSTAISPIDTYRGRG